MKEDIKFYDDLRKTYPKTMSKEQFRIAAHISKATALYLIENKLIPCRDTKKKTRRYTIKTNDVIAYLQDRVVSPEKYLATDGWYLKRSGNKHARRTCKDKLLRLTPEQVEMLRAYYQNEMSDLEDVMSVKVFAEFLGYSPSTIINWCNNRYVKAFDISGRFMIPKICAIDFLVSPKAHSIQQKSFRHKLFCQDFLAKHRLK
ncbi:MAG: helix-turn-helix domain-containing protein [Clostridiales bacterium]|nr:helix-turn-helix domain-containing protein [Clostridiales bacterium]